MKIQYTERGFEIGTWSDYNGTQCELQQSSAIDLDHPRSFHTPGLSLVWLGIRLEDAAHRMHLNRPQVTELVKRLSRWLECGSFFPEEAVLSG